MNKMGSDLIKKLSTSKAWELWSVVPDRQLPEKLTEISLKIKEGQPYTEIKIIPSEDAMQDTIFETEEPSHFIYGKLSQRKLRKRKAKSYIRMVHAECFRRGETNKQYKEQIDLAHFTF